MVNKLQAVGVEEEETEALTESSSGAAGEGVGRDGLSVSKGDRAVVSAPLSPMASLSGMG